MNYSVSMTRTKGMKEVTFDDRKRFPTISEILKAAKKEFPGVPNTELAISPPDVTLIKINPTTSIQSR